MVRAVSLARLLVVLALLGACEPIPAFAGDVVTIGLSLQAEAVARCEARLGPGTAPEAPFTSDGCTAWPDNGWGACCLKHDMDYWAGGSIGDRWRSDARLAGCVGGPVGWVMFVGVRVVGAGFWPHPARWGYGRQYPRIGP